MLTPLARWENNVTPQNLFYLAKSYDFIAEFLQSTCLLPMRRQLLQENFGAGQDNRRRINKELVKAINDGPSNIPAVLNCAHLACELALKQFLVRAAFCDGAHQRGGAIPSGVSFPATHSISKLFKALPAHHKNTIQDCYEEWLKDANIPYALATQFEDVIQLFSEEQMEIRYNTIKDPDNEIWIAVTAISRFLCRGMN